MERGRVLAGSISHLNREWRRVVKDGKTSEAPASN
jgi:hypothetical protein